MALTLLGLTVLVFLMLRLIPGTVVEQMIGADAIVSPEMVAQLTRFFGLDQPWWVQYSRWLGSLAQGDLGTSWRTGKPVILLILERRSEERRVGKSIDRGGCSLHKKKKQNNTGHR